MTVMLVALCRAFGIEFIVVFANTGQEDERTLAFVDRCDREFGLDVVYVEAEVHMGRVASTHRVVDFAAASRNGEPFEAVIAKYGISNRIYPHCNRELKLNPIHDYAESIGWERGSYDTAIGLRADEMDRQNISAEKQRLIYPLIRLGKTKVDVLTWWREQLFDLYIPEHLGNCVWCWKKSDRKHLTLAAETPGAFNFPARMEALYPFSGANADGQPRRFFRNKWTTVDIIARSRLPFEPFVDGNHVHDPELDGADGCIESCDIHASLDLEWEAEQTVRDLI